MSDQEAAGSPPKRKRRFRAGVVTLLVGTLVLASAYLWLERRALVSMQVRDVLQTAGVEVFDVEITAVGFSGAQARLIRIGEVAQPDLLIEDLKIAYSLVGLLAGRIDGVEIGSLWLKAGISSEGLELGQLDPLFVGTQPSTTGTFSVGDVSIDDLQIEVSFPQGIVDVAGSMRLLQRDGELHVQPSDRCLRVGLRSLQLGAGMVDDVSGVVCLADPDDGVSWPMETDLALTISDLPLVLRSDDRDVLLEANLAGLSIHLGGMGDPDNGGLSVRVDGSRLVLPGFDFALSDVGFEVTVEDMATSSGRWSLTRARVEDLSPAARFSPVRLVGEGQLSSERITFDLMVSDPVSFAPLLSVGEAMHWKTGMAGRLWGSARLFFSPVTCSRKILSLL